MTAKVENVLLAELDRTIARQPTAVAMRDESTSISYRQMDEQVHQQARDLVKAGIKVGDRVAIVAENSVDYLLSALAVWRAGGVIATIYPSSTAADLRSTIWDSDPVLVLADEVTAPRVREAAQGTWPVRLVSGREIDDFKLATARNDVAGKIPDDLALICYSSGTTARPKAIMLSSQALLAGAATFSEVWGLDASDTTLVCLPMAWLYGLNTSSITTLLAGGTVVPLRRSRPEMLAEAIEKYQATVLPAVTTVLNRLTEYLEQNANYQTDSLRLVVSGGEPRNEKWFAKFTELTQVEIYDNYCASESFPLITYDPRRDAHPIPGASGRLVPGAQIRILDAQRNPVPVGKAGEAESRGPGLMHGYWNDPVLTAQAFTDDGWYRTKDLVKQDEDGYFHVIGRASDMIIRGGSNISPAEVEHVLREVPDITDAVVLGVPDDTYGEEVVAVIEWDSHADLPEDEIEEHLRSRLAGFKVPSRYLSMPVFPKNTTTGKTDRRQILNVVKGGVAN